MFFNILLAFLFELVYYGSTMEKNKKPKTFTTRLPPALHAALKAFAEPRGMKMQFVIAEALREFLAKRRAA